MQEKLSEAETGIMRLEEATERSLTDEDKKSNADNVGAHSSYRKSQQKEQSEASWFEGEMWDLWDIVELCSENLEEELGIWADAAEFEIERIHRLLAPIPGPERPPRLVLIRFLRQSVRDKVIIAAKEKQGFLWEGCQLSVFPDMTKELADKRKSFTSVKRKLQKMEVKYTLAYPATLRFK